MQRFLCGHGRFGPRFLDPLKKYLCMPAVPGLVLNTGAAGVNPKFQSSGRNGEGRQQVNKIAQHKVTAEAGLSFSSPDRDAMRLPGSLSPQSGSTLGPPAISSARTRRTSGSPGSAREAGQGCGEGGEGVYDATSDARRNWPPFASAEGPEGEVAVAAAQSGGKEEGWEPESRSRSRSGGDPCAARRGRRPRL